MATSDTPFTAAAFLSTIGVNTHLNYTDGAYFNTRQVLADLQYLGVTQLRDTLSVSAGQSLVSYKLLADHGVTFDFIAGAASQPAIAAKLALIDTFVAIAPGAVGAVEGLNEINNWPITWSNGDTGLQAGLDAQAALYAAVHADPALRGVPVYYLTGYGSGGVAAGPEPVAAGLADYNNEHPYANWGRAPGAFVSRDSLRNSMSPTAPAVFTETGYSTNTSVKGQYGGVSQTVQAKYTLDLLFDGAKAGIAKTYLYELLDAYAPGSRQGDDGFGLFDDTGAPKLVATALHNLTTLLQDAGTGAVPGSVPAFTVSGLPAAARFMTIQKTDGSTWVALWAEPQIWDMTTGTEIAAPPSIVTLTTGAAHRTIAVYDPLAGTTAIAGATDASTISVTLSDHPLLIQLSAATVGAATPPKVIPKASPSTEASPAPAVLTFTDDKAAGGAPTTVTGVAVADRIPVERDDRIAALTIGDTAARLGQGTLAVLGAESKVKSIVVTDRRPIAMGYTDYANGAAGIAKLAAGATLTVTATATTLGTAAALAKLGTDSKVGSIALSGGTTLTLAQADYAANRAALAKIAGPYQIKVTGVAVADLAGVERDGRVAMVKVADTTTRLAARLPALGADRKVQAIATTDAVPFTLGAAAYAAGKAALNKLPVYTATVTDVSVAALAGVEANGHVMSITVADSAARLGGKRLATLGRDAKVVAVRVTDGRPVVLNAAGAATGGAGLAKLAGNAAIAVRDASAALSGGTLDALQAHAAQVGAIDFTDALTPVLSLSRPQLLADAALLGKIAKPFILNVTGVDGEAPAAVRAVAASAGKLEGLALTRTDGSHHVELIGSGLTYTATRNDEIIARGRNETITFRGAGFGAASVTGYAPGDRLAFSKSLFSGFQDLKAHTAGSHDAVIRDARGDTLTLKGVAPAALTPSMFSFV